MSNILLHYRKGKVGEEFFFCNYRSGLPLSTHRPVTTKNTGKYDIIGDKKEQKQIKYQ